MSVQIDVPGDGIAHFCRRNRIARLALFGSVLRDDFGPESDVDVLVEFEQGAVVGLIGLTRSSRLDESSYFAFYHEGIGALSHCVAGFTCGYVDM